MIEGQQICRLEEILIAYLTIPFSHTSSPAYVTHNGLPYLGVHTGTPSVRLPCVSQTMGTGVPKIDDKLFHYGR